MKVEINEKEALFLKDTISKAKHKVGKYYLKHKREGNIEKCEEIEKFITYSDNLIKKLEINLKVA